MHPLGVTWPLLLAVHVSADSALRLRVDGSLLIDPYTNEPINLHGVNWWSGYFQSDDGLDLETQLPSANLVRLVGILWDNAP